MDGRTDGKIDRKTDGQRQTNIPPPSAGDKNYMSINFGGIKMAYTKYSNFVSSSQNANNMNKNKSK